MINNLAQEVYKNAVDKGFYENGNGLNVGERIALIHSEVSEALEADRKNKYCVFNINVINDIESTEIFVEEFKSHVKGTFEEEMADIVIRVMDMCALKGIDLEQHIKAKMRYNSTREKYHGKKY